MHFTLCISKQYSEKGPEPSIDSQRQSWLRNGLESLLKKKQHGAFPAARTLISFIRFPYQQMGIREAPPCWEIIRMKDMNVSLYAVRTVDGSEQMEVLALGQKCALELLGNQGECKGFK